MLDSFLGQKMLVSLMSKTSLHYDHFFSLQKDQLFLVNYDLYQRNSYTKY